ncbi:MAG: threonine ammonia-lyase [Rhodospirillales bacterium]|nr:threonine ammonia-lyase [Rhodospirillales bacterium]
MVTVTLDNVRQAAKVLEGAVERTPCTHARTLSQITGAEIWVKFENLQYTGSFKDRGAYVKLHSLSDREKAAGVVAMSAGNHAQGVAYAAQRLGIPATIVMPVNTPFVKAKRTGEFGANVVLEGSTLAESAARAHKIAEIEGLTFIHPYDDPKVIAGQGTVALEMLTDAPDLDVLVVPVGGGGLIAGMAVAAKGINPNLDIIGVEAGLYPFMHRKLYGGDARVGGQTIAEGIAVKDVGEITSAMLEGVLSDILLVAEDDMEHAVCLYLGVEKTLAEGAGAAGLAAIVANPDRFKGRKVGLVLSGGNIDPRLLASVLMRDMVREGRISRLRLEIPDAPGALGQVCNAIGDGGGNIIEVAHQRIFSVGPAKEAELVLAVETRDREHLLRILEGLSSAGFPVALLDREA